MQPDMSLHFHLLTRNRLAILAVVCALLATLAAGAREWRGRNLKAEETKGFVVVEEQLNNRPIPILLLNLTRFGFEPRSMKVPAGRCQFAIRNITGLENVDLQVSLKNAERLLLERLPQARQHWERALVLPVGEYVISVPGKPQWTFSLIVTPPGN